MLSVHSALQAGARVRNPMPERGGPTTQSGINYQNSIAALFLGRLCDMQMRPGRKRVIQVRVEAPSSVDDIVVTYADYHQDWIQAKENISKGDEVWSKLWRDFETQRWGREFNADDRLILVIGTHHACYRDLRELCARTGGESDYQGWQRRLTGNMTSLVANIRVLLSPEHQDDQSILAFFSRIDIWPIYTEEIERDHMPLWIPPSNTEPLTLFRLLRDKVGGYSRYRKIFRRPQLLAELSSDHCISIVEPPSSGVPVYRESIAQATPKSRCLVPIWLETQMFCFSGLLSRRDKWILPM